jgi:hypothetical protein
VTEEEFHKKVAVKVEALWAKVFESSNKVLHQHLKYGLSGFSEVPRPNVHDMLITLRVFDSVLDVLSHLELPYDQSRQILNAKAQITNMERVALAVEASNEVDYDAAVEALERQAPF